MLEELYIKDFALIRETRVAFGPSLNILTGETGAGKSILLGALGLALGGKATTDMIRSGTPRSIVEAVFRLPKAAKSERLLQKLQEHGLDDSDGNLILKREITNEGKGRSFINAQQVPVSLLKIIGRMLVDIHGQNEHQNILHIETHRQILDRFAGLRDQVKDLGALHRQREDLIEKLQSVTLNEDDKNRRVEILSYEIAEIEKADLNENRELDDLINEEKSLAHAEQILRDIDECRRVLSEDEESVMKTLSWVERTLENDTQLDERLSSPLNQVKEANFLLQDAARDLRTAADHIQADPERLAIVRERIDLLQKILKKYGPQIENARNYLEKCRRELSGIELSSEEEGKIRKDIEQINAKLVKAAGDVFAVRREAAKKLESAVEAELKFLGMEDTRIRISIKWELSDKGVYFLPEEPDKKYVIHPHGLDQIELLLAGSSNETLRPLRKIASGGEMSRIMLALKKVIIESDPVFSMVFDEVDAGVGGRIAEAVGLRLAEISSNAQVIVITHLHQIAGLSPTDTVHLKVIKEKDEGSRIYRLNRDERIEEVARMIAGSEITDSALTHARSILSNNAS